MTQSRSQAMGALPWPDSGGSSALAAEAVYCLVSAGTILFNKHALSTYAFPAPNVLLTLQFGIAVLLLKILDFIGCLELEPLRWDIIKLWFPVNIIFVLMNATGFYALMSVSAGMFTVLKNLSNLLTILGDWYFFDKTYSWQVWACLGLMIVSAALGGWSDLSFSPSGYAWQLVNCVFTAGYSLHLSSVVRAASPNAAANATAGSGQTGSSCTSSTHSSHGGASGSGGAATHIGTATSRHSHGGLGHSGSEGGEAGDELDHDHTTLAASGPPPRRRLTELSMVYYNNVLSVPPLILLSLVFGEPARLLDYPHLGNPEFNLVVLMGALLGFGVSFASIWCMSRTSATIYSLTGSMNKVVVAVVGMWYFAEPASATNLLSIGMGLVAGFLFVFAKAAPLSRSVGAVSGGGKHSGDGGTSTPGGVLRAQLDDADAGEGEDDEEAGLLGGKKSHVLTVRGPGGIRELTPRVGVVSIGTRGNGVVGAGVGGAGGV